VRPDLAERYHRTRASLFGTLGPYADTFQHYDAAIQAQADPGRKAEMAAEREEVRFLSDEPEAETSEAAGGGNESGQ
jgi:hypothetical protein